MKLKIEIEINSPSRAHEFVLFYRERVPELEHFFINDPHYAVSYAENALHRPWLEAEPCIMINARAAYNYVIGTRKCRWIPAEPYIYKDPEYWERYLRYLRDYQNYSDHTLIKWMEKGIDNILLDILIEIGMSKDVQENLIQLRPDLINKIQLDPSLKRKYQHELNLSGVDI